MVDGGGGAAVVATAAVGGHRAQSTVKSGSRKNERRGGSGGDRDGVWNIQQSNKSGSERNGGFCNGGSGGDRDRVDNGDHDDSGMDDGDGDDDGVILVDGLVKKYITISIIRQWERRSNYHRMPPPPPTTTKMTTWGEDCRRRRRRRNIISDETNDINAPADSGMRGWGGRGWALSMLAVAMDRSELPRVMPTGAIERFIVHVQTHNKQIHNNQLVLLFILFWFPFTSSSCMDRSQPPVSNQNPFLISEKWHWILCQNGVQHGDYGIFFACSQSACV